MEQRAVREDIELSIGPHPARPHWRVMRVSYAAHGDHEERVAAALDALFGPPPKPIAEVDHARAADD